MAVTHAAEALIAALAAGAEDASPLSQKALNALRRVEVVFVPVVNPDGYERTYVSTAGTCQRRPRPLVRYLLLLPLDVVLIFKKALTDNNRLLLYGVSPLYGADIDGLVRDVRDEI